jgi:regulator of replication initiation timing
LASFIRFRQIEEKLNNLKQNIEELKEKQETIIEAINSLLKKNERE